MSRSPTARERLIAPAGTRSLLGQRRAHHGAIIMIAGDGDKGNFQRRQQAFKVLVLFLGRRVGEVAGNHYQVGPRRETIELGDAAGQRRRGVDLAVGERPGRLICRSEICAMRIGRAIMSARSAAREWRGLDC